MPEESFLCRHRTVQQHFEKPQNAVKFREVWLKHEKHDRNRMGFRCTQSGVITGFKHATLETQSKSLPKQLIL